MRHRSKTVLLALVATMAVSALASASALATPQWMVNGAAFHGEETLKVGSTGSVTLKGELAPLGGKFDVITCTGISSKTPPEFETKKEEEQWNKLNAPKISNNTEGRWSEMVLSGCKMTVPSGCSVPGVLSGLMGTSGLADEGINVFDKFGTDTQTFAVYTVSGCSLEGRMSITGAPRCQLVKPSIEAAIKQCEFTATSGSTLKAGTEAATLTATVNLELSGANKGKVWTGKP